jgi:inosine-uridine nucleoside N-ribohydrolase
MRSRFCHFARAAQLWMLFVLAVEMASLASVARAIEPVPLIFDTDIGNDVDDVLALGVIHALMSRNECKLLAVTVSKDEALSAPFVDVINTFYGRSDVPIGVVHRGATPEASKYTGLSNERDGGKLRYPHRLETGSDAPDAVKVLRETLAKERDGSVVIVQVGFSTNLARLLESPPDEISSLSGVELAHAKVRLLSLMGGAFATTDKKPVLEYNIVKDIHSAQTLVAKWPTPIVFSGFEIGVAIPFPHECIERNFTYVEHHPLAEAYRLYNPPSHDRPCWDLTSVLYAVRPDDGYFDLSPPGGVAVSDGGMTSFTADTQGSHRYLILKPEQKIRVREALAELASEPPCTCLRPPGR